MEKISDQGRLRPWMGFVLFGILIAVMLVIATPLQINLGIPGLILTELIFLGMAVFYCLICKVKIKEVFPVKKVKFKEVIGCILMVIGMFPLSMILVSLTGIIIPASVKEVDDLTSFIYGNLNYPLAVLIIALLPAICEEAIHRGAILSNFRSLKKDWVIVLIMGLFFGINHLSVLRFLATMTMGLFFSYIMVKKNNLLLTMIMHFTNNFLSVSLAYLAGDPASSSSAAIDYSSALGVYLMIGFMSPVLITLGLMLINPEGHRKIRFLYAGILAVVMLVSGVAVTALTASKNLILNSTIGYKVSAEEPDISVLDFNIEEDCEATVVVILTQAEGDYRVRIDGDNGSNIINAEVPEGAIRMVTYNVGLQADHYTVTFVGEENAIGEQPLFQITIK